MSIARCFGSWLDTHKLSSVRDFAKLLIAALSSSSVLTATEVSLIAVPVAEAFHASSSCAPLAVVTSNLLKAASTIETVNALTDSAKLHLLKPLVQKA